MIAVTWLAAVDKFLLVLFLASLVTGAADTHTHTFWGRCLRSQLAVGPLFPVVVLEKVSCWSDSWQDGFVLWTCNQKIVLLVSTGTAAPHINTHTHTQLGIPRDILV